MGILRPCFLRQGGIGDNPCPARPVSRNSGRLSCILVDIARMFSPPELTSAVDAEKPPSLGASPLEFLLPALQSAMNHRLSRSQVQSSTLLQFSERQGCRCDLYRSGGAIRPSVSPGTCTASAACSCATAAACGAWLSFLPWPITPQRRTCSTPTTGSASCGRSLPSCHSTSPEAQWAS